MKVKSMSLDELAVMKCDKEVDESGSNATDRDISGIVTERDISFFSSSFRRPLKMDINDI